MKAMYTGFAAIIGIAICAHFVLGEMGFSSREVGASQNVRLD